MTCIKDEVNKVDRLWEWTLNIREEIQHQERERLLSEMDYLVDMTIPQRMKEMVRISETSYVNSLIETKEILEGLQNNIRK